MSWLYSLALVEEYSVATSSDGAHSAPSKETPMPRAYWHSDRTTEFSSPSRSGMTYALLTETHGEDVLTSFLEDFPAKTSAPQEKAPASAARDPDYGPNSLASFTKYDQTMSLWKTPQCSLLGDSEPYSATWPRWGLMLDGVCWEQIPSVHHTAATAYGFWQTPVADAAINRRNGKFNSRGEPLLSVQAKIFPIPTPTVNDAKNSTLPPSQIKHDNIPGHLLRTGEKPGGTLNPTWVEWLMGWPLGWTDLQPLATDKFQQWRQKHGSF